eukprot:3941938-Rhodomonas_salina.4
MVRYTRDCARVWRGMRGTERASGAVLSARMGAPAGDHRSAGPARVGLRVPLPPAPRQGQDPDA